MERRSRATEIREARGISITELAARAGLTRQTIYSIERDPEHRPSVEVMVKVARALGVTVDDLLEPAAAS